jgi:hypothetical protein
MFITLSFRKYAEVIREAENLDPSTTDAEIAVRLDYYSTRIWDHMFRFGIKFLSCPERTPDVAAFQVSIAGVGRNYQTGDFDWQRLQEGLNWLRPVAVTVTQDDIEHICSGPVATAMSDRFDEYSPTLQRILPSQIQPAVEAACLKYAWGSREIVAYTGDPALDREFAREEELAQLQRVGDDPHVQALLRDLERRRQQDAFNESEIAAYKAQEDARLERIMNGEF